MLIYSANQLATISFQLKASHWDVDIRYKADIIVDKYVKYEHYDFDDSNNISQVNLLIQTDRLLPLMYFSQQKRQILCRSEFNIYLIVTKIHSTLVDFYLLQ